MSLSGYKRNHNEIPMSIIEESISKKSKIINQLVDGVYDYKNINGNVNILGLNIIAKVKDYNVTISKTFGKTKYSCTCTTDVYKNYHSNYCKHISMAIKEIIKDYLRENDNFFTHKGEECIFRENIEFLKSSIKDIKICNINYEDSIPKK
jgi:hypothetical protein